MPSSRGRISSGPDAGRGRTSSGPGVRRGRISSGPGPGILHNLDAVTIDAFGTLVVLDDPTERLHEALAEQGIERSTAVLAAAFSAEASHYRPRSARGRDGTSLAELRAECVGVFLEHADADLDPSAFVPAFIGAIRFRPADGAPEALAALRGAGLELACVANWDVSLHEHLERLGLAGSFHTILSSAEAGVEKPDPEIFRLALSRLDVSPGRALHVGDEAVDEDGACAAGMAFEGAPLATLPDRLGLR
jgi:putative hydrolase of the HAD superfamily